MAWKLDPFGWLICLAAFALLPRAAWAAMPDQCKQDHDRFAENWKSTAGEALLFVCHGHYVRDMKVLVTKMDSGDFRLTVALAGKTYRSIVFGTLVERLRAQSGNYVLNSDKSCFIRGNLSEPAVLHFGDQKLPQDLTYFAHDNALDYVDCEAPK